jgi:hypothetical protein
MKKKIFVKGRAAFMLNQHAAKFADKRTKRNRERGTQKRKAIEEES